MFGFNTTIHQLARLKTFCITAFPLSVEGKNKTLVSGLDYVSIAKLTNINYVIKNKKVSVNSKRSRQIKFPSLFKSFLTARVYLIYVLRSDSFKPLK